MYTPFQKLTGLIPNLKHLRVFGCADSVLLTTLHDKLFAKVLPVTFIGYDTQSKAYRVYDTINMNPYLDSRLVN